MTATASKPRNKRLSAYNRETIFKFARAQVEKTADRTALNAAYEKAADAIHAKVLADNPPKDMATLTKYGLADKDQCIYISTGGYNYDRWEYRDGDHRIILRAYRKNGCNRNAILLDGEADLAYRAFKEASLALEQETSRRLSDFKALIYNTQSFNEVAEVWPAVEALREAIVGSGASLIVLSADVTDRLKADPAFLVEA